MSKRILIVEDEFIVANDLSMTLERAGYDVCGIADSVEEAQKLTAQYKPQLVLLDIHLKGSLTGIDFAKQLAEENVAFVYLSANSNQKILEEAKATQPYGFMVKPFREKDVLVSLDIASYLHEQKMMAKQTSELQLQNSLSDIIADTIGWDHKLLKIAKTIQPYISFDFLRVQMKDVNAIPNDGLSFLRTSFNEYQVIGLDELLTITGMKKSEFEKLQETEPDKKGTVWYNNEDFSVISRQHPFKKLIAKTFGMEAHLELRIKPEGMPAITFSFYSRKADAYGNRHLVFTNKLQRSFLSVTDAFAPVNKVEERLAPGNRIKENKAAGTENFNGFEGIIGHSHLLLTALDHLSLVAPTETSVLILGESGTGKERIARSIHQLSPRGKKPIVIVNCAALPTHLIESELFGHERGAFTGATDRRIGKFEQAAGSSIFLDEIGELPLESQAKLLRVLQEKEVERLGGKETIKIDVRIIAATNCNLEKEVAAGKFRLDLYYRLNIFPILLPPLRERKEDIPVLAEYFIEKYAAKAGRQNIKLSKQAIAELMQYNWPGNVRELEHLLERSVLLSRENTIEKIALPTGINKPVETTSFAAPVPEARVKSIDENEKEYILSVLRKCNGRISGPGGAAELLDVPSTTLNSKMKRLGITRKHVSDNY